MGFCFAFFDYAKKELTGRVLEEKEINAATNNLYLQRESGDVGVAHTQETLRKSYKRVNLEKGVVIGCLLLCLELHTINAV